MLTRHSIQFPDPYDFHKQSFTVRFYGYRNPNTVPLDDLNGCYHQAKDIAASKVTEGQGESPVGTNPQSWSSGNVYLRIEPGEQITWRDWSTVLIFLRHFVYENQFKGTQFLILKDGLGQIGTGSILREPEEKPSAPDPSVSVLPDPVPDPYNMRLERERMTIRFSGYRGFVSQVAVEGCVAAAYDDIQRHVSLGQTTMTAPWYSYSAGTVDLLLVPGPQLTWRVWWDIPLRIQGFVEDNGHRETQFVIVSDEFGQIGRGQLGSVNISGGNSSEV